MAFKDLAEFQVVEPLVLTIAGKEYSFPGQIHAQWWLRLQTMRKLTESGEAELDAIALTDDEETELRAEMMGEAEAEMLADGVTSAQFKVVWGTLINFHTYDRLVAEMVWNSQGEAVAPNRAARRAKKPAQSARPRGNSHGTSADRTPGKARAGTGEKSSSIGT